MSTTEIKRKMSPLFMWPVLFLCGLFVLPACSAQNALPPPDSVEQNGPPSTVNLLGRTFLSKQTPEEIRSFYESSAGPFQKSQQSKLEGRAFSSQPSALNASTVANTSSSDGSRVTIEWKEAPALPCDSELFTDLRQISQAFPEKKAEFESLCTRYSYLESAFFQSVPDNNNSGELVAADKILFHRTGKGEKQTAFVDEVAALSDLLKQTTDAIAQLRWDGLGGLTEELGKRVVEIKANSSGIWDDAVHNLSEADKFAYRTKIVLPTDSNTR